MNNIWCIFFIFALSILIFKSTYVKSSLIIGNGRIQTRVLLSWSDRSVNCATDTSGALKNVNLNTFFNNGPFPAALFFNFVFSIQLTGFEPQISGVGSDRSTNWATTIFALFNKFYLVTFMAP